jgi:hypothetical protein
MLLILFSSSVEDVLDEELDLLRLGGDHDGHHQAILWCLKWSSIIHGKGSLCM